MISSCNIGDMNLALYVLNSFICHFDAVDLLNCLLLEFAVFFSPY